MRQPAVALALAGLLLVSGATAGVTATADVATPTADGDEPTGVDAAATEAANDSARENYSAGQQVTGVVGFHDARFEGRLDTHRFKRAVRAAEAEERQAEVVASEFERSADRLDRLEDRATALEEAREAGSIDQRTYLLRSARLAADIESVDEHTLAIADAAADLPPAVRREEGLDRTAVRDLRQRASSLQDRDAVQDGADLVAGDAAEDGRLLALLFALIGDYNRHVEGSDLGTAGDQLRNEQVNLHVQQADGSTLVVSFRTDGQNRIAEFRQGPRNDATIRMRTDEATVRAITRADDPAAAFRSAVRDGEIVIEGITPTESAKWTVINFARDAAGTVEDVFDVFS